MSNQYSPIKEAEKKIRKLGGMVRTAQALSLGIQPRILYELRKTGRLIQLSRGIFRLTDKPIPANLDLVTVALRVPQSVICLISALSFHSLTTEIPHEVYLALPGPGAQRTRNPRLDYPPIRVFRFSGPAFSEGIGTHMEAGVKIRVYNPAKTIADCFKFRNRVGLDVCIEALKFYRRKKNHTIDNLLYYARICRVEKVIMPYLQAIG